MLTLSSILSLETWEPGYPELRDGAQMHLQSLKPAFLACEVAQIPSHIPAVLYVDFNQEKLLLVEKYS